MDRLSQLRGDAGGSRDSTLDTTSPPSESFMTANESSSKYYSLSEVDSTFDISSIKDVSLASTAAEADGTITESDELISNLSPIGKKSDILDSYKIDTQIEAANILSGGVAIFDDNENSYDGDELVIDDNVDVDDKSNSELKQPESIQFKADENLESGLISEGADIASKDTEVVLQIDGKNVDAIDIGNGLYLYRKEGQEELAAVQISDDDQQQPSFKFLKVRENAEGNLEVYEEIEIEVPKEVPAKEGKMADKNTSSHVPIKNISKVVSDSACNKVAEKKIKPPQKEPTSTTTEVETEVKETSPDCKSEVNFNGKTMKFSESRKSPVIGSFTPMTYHSTPNKEGIPLTKTMVDQQLHPNRHTDLSNVKKTIEVHTDSCKNKQVDTPIKNKDVEDNKLIEISSTETEIINVEPNDKDSIIHEKDSEIISIKENIDCISDSAKTESIKPATSANDDKGTKNMPESAKNILMEQDSAIDSTEKVATNDKNKQVDDINEKVDDINKHVEVIVPDDDINKKDKHFDNLNKHDDGLIIVDDEIPDQIKGTAITDENKMNIAESVQATSSNSEEMNPVKTRPISDESKNEPMEIDDETALTIVETIPICEEEKANIQENTQTKDAELKEVIGNKGDEAILIEDDDDDVVEEVIIDSNEKEVHVATDSLMEIKLDDQSKIIVKTSENVPASSNIVAIEKAATHNKYSMIDETVPEKSTSVNAHAKPKLQSDTPIPLATGKEVKTDTTTPLVIEKAETKDTYTDTETHRKLEKNAVLILPSVKAINPPPSSIEVVSKNMDTNATKQQDYTTKPEPKPLKELDDKQVSKPAESSSIAITQKHVAAANLSPLLEKKQQSLIAPKFTLEKQIPTEKIECVKPLLSNITVTSIKPTEPILQNRTTDISKKEPIKPTQLSESVPTVFQSQESKSKINKTQNTIKEKGVTETNSTFEKFKHLPVQPVKMTYKKPVSDPKASLSTQRVEKKDTKVTSKSSMSEKTGVLNIEMIKVPKYDLVKSNPTLPQKHDVTSTSSKITIQSVKNKDELKNIVEVAKPTESNPINNNHAAVPFGKWTEANRQEFLSKFKTKTLVTPSNTNQTNQLKNSNDLNRRDVLKKIDSQRQSNNALSKTQDANKHNMRPETAAFSNKPNIISKDSMQESKVPQKNEIVEVKPKPIASKIVSKTEIVPKTQSESLPTVTVTSGSKKEVCQRTGVVQNLIDKTIEGMIHRSVSTQKAQDELKLVTNDSNTSKTNKSPESYEPEEQASLDEIEMKMNELHGIPFIERPPHELPKVYKAEPKTYSKIEKEKPVALSKTKIPNLLPFPNKIQQKVVKESVTEIESEDEIIEHEPITGDIDLHKKNQVVELTTKEKTSSNISQQVQQVQQKKNTTDSSTKEAIITETDFDKFARRNSITYENRLTVNFDSKETHNVVQTAVEKDISTKCYSRKDTTHIDPKQKLPFKYQNVRPKTNPAKVQAVNKPISVTDDASNRNQSKLQKAYHSALTAKRQMTTEYPITIIVDKPVKVVFMESVDYVPSQLNVQGQDLSPAKKMMPSSDVTVSTCGDSLDSDILDSTDDARSQDEIKTKTKHQRKQVLTPVDEPEIELIEPKDLGIEVSPKKKRKTDDDRTDKTLKYPMRKKFYLLGSTVTEEKYPNLHPVELAENPTAIHNENVVLHNPVSAIDNLVKAAELIETQTENMNSSIVSNVDSLPNTPAKRGRGRPRKYPLTPDGTVDKSKVATPSPQKKPRLIDAKTPRRDTVSDDSDSDDVIIKENWTMGKINENIVCPICNKLFRTENVVFKHVKHCTGPSPSRSDSDKTSPRRMRLSRDFDTKSRESNSDDMDIDDDKPLVVRQETPKKRKSKDSHSNSDDKDDIIVIEDTPIKEKSEKVEEKKPLEFRKSRTKIPHKNNELVCEFCGKRFRQLSYLVSHKLQHKKPDKIEPKKPDKEAPAVTKSVYSCEVCKKEFRKLHHLVQHRIIHNPSSAPVRPSRKSSSEQSEKQKVEKVQTTAKQSDDTSAGFRCEPCDKSFRKLHHLVEHRETHDGINRQKSTTAAPGNQEKPAEKPITLHQCDVCKKTFRKAQHLSEHREQHVETSSEKSDDKSVKSALSTKDIIHECSLCYMVFPNEHSLNKHTVICLRKKRQSKQPKPVAGTEGGEEGSESSPPEEKVDSIDSPKPLPELIKKAEEKPETVEKVEIAKGDPTTAITIIKPTIEVTTKDKNVEPVKIIEKEKVAQKVEAKAQEPQVPPAKRDFVDNTTGKTDVISEVPEKIKKMDAKEPITIHETPKKKTPLKDKSASTAKRLKNTATPALIKEEVKSAVESSDDDEVRYMLNPNFKEEVVEEKVFMKVRAKKRSSLQIERPNSKDLVKRRTSLQHPPKIPRLKAKPVETNQPVAKKEIKTPKLEPVPSTDSDDSETTKYSFPITIPEKTTKPAQVNTPKDSERKIVKKSLADKRKSLSGIAKRKSLGKAALVRHKASPLKQVKKRMLDAEHRCDCGQLFSSAALLSRHTTLAHTPPRIRRRRSPPPPPPPPASKPDKPKQSPGSRKSSARSDSATSTSTKPSKSDTKPNRKSSAADKASKSPGSAKKVQPEKSETKSGVKPRRTTAHRGVPVPDKMKKLMQKNK